MKRYIVYRGTCVLHIDEGDPIPSMDEIDEADRFTEAIAAGDPRVELTPAADRPGCLEASWFTRARVA